MTNDDALSDSGHPSSRARNTDIRARRKRLRVHLGFAVVGLALLLCVAAGVLTYQASAVRNRLEGAADLVPRLSSQLSEGDQKVAQTTFETIRSHTSAARRTVDAPLWNIATVIPFAGANFSAVREVAVSADDLANLAAAPLLKVYTTLDFETLAPHDGRIDIAKLQDAAPSIIGAADAVRLSHERMASIDHSKLMPQLVEPISSATDQLKKLDATLTSASSVAQLLPAMLGANEPRSYLVLVQNSAETRATGGIPGALALLNADGGQLSLGKQSSAVELGAFIPSLEVDPEQTRLYSARLGTQMQNVNLTPDFPTAALTAKKMWEERHSSDEVDGVITLDPTMLSYLLGATGPVDLADPKALGLIKGTSLPSSLTKTNVVATVLSDVYREIAEPATQDVYFAAVASEVFTALTEGQGDSRELLRAVSAGATENRLYLWSNRENEQMILARTPLAGSVVGNQNGGAAFGVYFNDGTGAKMDFYAERTVQLLSTCESEGYRNYTVRMTVANNAPLDAATSLPAYVTGGGTYGIAPGRMRTNYVVYGPAQSFVDSATVDGKSVPVSSGKHGSRPVGSVSLELGPGDTSTIDMIFSGVVQDSEPQLRVTPSIHPTGDVIGLFEHTACGQHRDP